MKMIKSKNDLEIVKIHSRYYVKTEINQDLSLTLRVIKGDKSL